MPCHDEDKSKMETGCCGACHHDEVTDSPSRRRFLKVILGFFAFLWAMMASFPFVRYLTSSKQASASSTVSSATIGKVSDFPVDSGKNIEFGGKPALVFRDKKGDFHAYSAICSHLGCTVQYQKADQVIFCACHGGEYDPLTGDNIAGPPPKPLSPYKITLEGENVVIHRV